MSAPTVPFVRPLYGPQDPRDSKPGGDVVGIKRGLSRAGYLPWGKFTPDYGVVAVNACKRFQNDHGILATGHYGPPTHEALRTSHRKGHPAQWAFDDKAIELLHDAYVQQHTSPEERAAAQMIEVVSFWIAHRSTIHYAEIRPFPLVRPPDDEFTTDCSGFFDTVYFAIGAPNPNGGDYNGLAYTVSLVGRGHAVRFDELEVGDAIFYGYTRVASPAFPVGSPTHVAPYIGGGYVGSHGSEPGPLKLPVRYRPDVHSARRYGLVA